MGGGSDVVVAVGWILRSEDTIIKCKTDNYFAFGLDMTI